MGLVTFAWVRGIGPLALADAAAPGVALGQAVGRWGDYFNQKLFGEPSGLPWAIRISPENRPPELADAQTFHPAFLYESIWDVLICLLLLWIARRFAAAPEGRRHLLALLHPLLGRVCFIVGTLRVDPTSFMVWGSVRGDLVVAGVLALGSALILLIRHLFSPRGHSQKKKVGAT